jgi:hypothetical protein
MVATAEQHDMTRSDSGESEESEGTRREEIGELEDTESIEKGEGETERRIDEKVKNEDTKEVHPQAGEDNATCCQSTPFDWATETDELIGPGPSASNFCPIKPPSPLVSPKPAPCLPNPATPSQPIRAPLKPNNPDPAPSHFAHTSPIPVESAPIVPKLAPSDSVQVSSIPVDPAPTEHAIVRTNCADDEHSVALRPNLISSL